MTTVQEDLTSTEPPDAGADPAPHEAPHDNDPSGEAGDPDPMGRAIRLAPLGELRLAHASWVNPRTVSGLDDASIAELAASILSGTVSTADGRTIAGVETPLEVVPVSENGSLISVVIDGQRRHRAMEHLGLSDDTLVRVIDLEGGIAEPVTKWTSAMTAVYFRRSLGMVSSRRGLSSQELVAACRQLRDSRNPDTGEPFTLSEIGTIVSRSDSWVSKMLKAVAGATPALILSWERGELTDEQFKGLALAKDQSAALNEIKAAKEAGDDRSARRLSREQVIAARRERIAEASKARAAAAKPAKASKDKSKDKEGKGKAPMEQTSLPREQTIPKRPPPQHVLAEMSALADKRTPTSEYVLGVLDAIAYCRGRLDAADFGKAWHSYVMLVSGTATRKPKKE